MRNSRTHQFVLVAAALGLLGCGDGEDESPIRMPVSLEFGVVVNDQELRCGDQYPDVGDPPVPFSVTDSRFYVHDVALLHGSLGWLPVELAQGDFQRRNLALLDFEDGCGPDGTAETHTTLSGGVLVPGAAEAAGNDPFVGVRFTLGLPAAENFVDLAKAAPPLDVTGMFWIWQFGYKYLKVDGSSPASGGGINPFFIHLGASGCPGTNPQAPPAGDCSAPNLAVVELLDFSPTAGRIVADLGALLATSDLSFNTTGTGPGCMSEIGDPECLTLLPRLGIDDEADQQLFFAE